MFYDMTWLERLLFLKRIKGGGSGHEETTTSNTFVTDMVAPLRKLLLSFAPKQSGSGDPSPTNVRPISGWDGVSVTVSPTLDTEAGQTYTTSLGQTVYGGTLDMVSGVLTVTMAMVDMGSLTWSFHGAGGQYSNYFDTNLPSDSIVGNDAVPANIKCEKYATIRSREIATSGYDNNVIALAKNAHRLIACDQSYSDAAVFKASLDGAKLVYELATPQTYQLTPQQINTLIGTNNILTDAEVSEIIYLKKAE